MAADESDRLHAALDRLMAANVTLKKRGDRYARKFYEQRRRAELWKHRALGGKGKN